MSFFSRLSVDMSNALSDAYGNFMYGDDAGKSAKLVFVAKPRVSLNNPNILLNKQQEEPNIPIPVQNHFDLGVTFLEVNGRAYVRNVIPDSAAEAAGVQPRDCVQFAVVLGGELVSLKEDESKAASYALDCEKRGFRTTFEEIKGMFSGCCITEEEKDREFWRTRQNNERGMGCSPKQGDGGNNSVSNINAGGKYPVVIVFRRTRKRHHATLGGMVPIGVPSFRLDDECDRAAALIRRLAPTADTSPDPDAWDEIVHDGTEWLLPNGSIMPPHPTSSPIGDWISHAKPTAQLTEDPSADAMTDSSLVSRTNYHNTGGGIKRVKSGDLTQTGEDTIPPDPWEATSNEKKNQVRNQMMAEALSQGKPKRHDDMEAAFIRGMIQKAVGLAFVRTSKVVLGVSFHIGSGIIIARLPDGTWSAPSAIGIFGAGVGFQFGVEVVEYIFILRTEESLAQFRLGGHVTLGGNLGAAFAGMGREALGAASIGGTMCSPKTHPNGYPVDVDDFDFEVKPIQLAPIVAYARTQGIYVGLSLEGSRIFTRHDINNRTYKFATGKAASAADILGGKVATPPEAEDLYASLHSAEFHHELNGIPRPPEILRKDSPNDWRYDRSTLTSTEAGGSFASPPFSFLSTITDADAEECSAFETTFKKFLYGGVSVQRLVPNAQSTGGKTRRERRTLWLMLPEVGALRLGFISKLHDGEGVSNSLPKKSNSSRASSNVSRLSSPRARLKMRRGRSNVSDSDDSFTEYSEVTEDYTITSAEDSRTFDENEPDTVNSMARTEDESATVRSTRSRNVHLSNKHSVALTDVTLLSQEPNVSIRFSPDDATEHLRFIAVHDCRGISLLFLANNFREAELLVCGLKLLIERETARLAVRGGIPINQLGRKAQATSGGGYISTDMSNQNRSRDGSSAATHDSLRLKSVRVRRDPSPATSSDNDDSFDKDNARYPPERIPEGRRSWSQVPGRSYLRDQASKSESGEDMIDVRRPVEDNGQDMPNLDQVPNYFYGQLIIREIVVNVKLPLPLPLCRVLLLDSSSPVISKWEVDRGDSNYSKSRWTFPPSTPRDLERHASEHKLIASGSMMGAHRVTSYQRMRNGSLVQLTETQIVDADDPEKVAFSIAERLPRRGFSVKVRILLRAINTHGCEATVLAEVRPIGKNMTNQVAVHRALSLVVEEIQIRYGTEGKGLLAGFLSVVNNLPESSKHPFVESPSSQSQPKTQPQHNQQNYPLQQLHPSSNTIPPNSQPAMTSKPMMQPPPIRSPISNGSMPSANMSHQGNPYSSHQIYQSPMQSNAQPYKQTSPQVISPVHGAQFHHPTRQQLSLQISSGPQHSTFNQHEQVSKQSKQTPSPHKPSQFVISPQQHSTHMPSPQHSQYVPATQQALASQQQVMSSSSSQHSNFISPQQSVQYTPSPQARVTSISQQQPRGKSNLQQTRGINNLQESKPKPSSQQSKNVLPQHQSQFISHSQNPSQFSSHPKQESQFTPPQVQSTTQSKPSDLTSSSPKEPNKNESNQSSQLSITGNSSRAAALANRRRMRYLSTKDTKSKSVTPELSRSTRSATPAKELNNNKVKTKSNKYSTDKFTILKGTDEESKPMTIEVKPLPKIRLDLMPAPREEDEEEDSSAATPIETKIKNRSARLSHTRTTSIRK